MLDDEYSLDVRVVVTSHPNGKLTCNTCQGTASACNSYVGDPL